MDKENNEHEQHNNMFEKMMKERVEETRGRFTQGGTFRQKCNLSVASNYILLVIFVIQTIGFIYFWIFHDSETEPCYANHYSQTPVTMGAGQDINSRYYNVLILGSITGFIELVRNILNIWAKHAKYQKLEVAFSIIGFLTAFLYIFNFILMNLWRFSFEGQVCSGDFLTAE